MAVALPLIAANGDANSAYLNVAKYATIDEAGATVDGMETIYKYTEVPGGYWLTLSNYGVMKTDDTQNWFTNEIIEADNSDQYTGPWIAADVFQGPAAYFGNNTAYSAKFKQPTKKQTFYVTFCTQVKQYAYNLTNTSYYILKMEIYECTKNANGSITESATPIETLVSSTIGAEVLSSSELDPEKVYKVVISNAYSYLYEIAFKTPGLFDGEVTTPVAYEATNVEEEHVTMSWSACPGAKSYTVRTYPCDDTDKKLRGLYYREKFTNFTDGQTLEDYQSLDAYTDHPAWIGYSLSGADGGIVIENNGSITSPMSDIKIAPYIRKFTMKFKAKPYNEDGDGQLMVTMGSNIQTFDISGPEKEYTFVVERGLNGSIDYMSQTYPFYIFKNTYYFNPYSGEAEEDHRVILTDFKFYYGDFGESQQGPSTKYVVPGWSGDTTFVSNIPETTFSFGTALTDIAHYNGSAYWIYDVKSVYYGGQESEWSNKIYYSTQPWPEFLEDDDEPVQPIVGDVNGDGEVNTVDITILYNYILNGDAEDMVHGDQDGDGEITSVDVTVVYNVLLGV